jgi:CO dehydrogenase/acetyl-CoA synthase beta subunit
MRRVIAAAFAPAEDDAIDLSSIELAEFVEWITIPDVSTKLDDDDDEEEEEEEEEGEEEDIAVVDDNAVVVIDCSSVVTMSIAPLSRIFSL